MKEKLWINKILLTNLFFSLLFLMSISFLQGEFATILKFSSLFALSGAITNWLAIFMLFEKVPLLYGSGVIPNRFQDFKDSIRNIILDNFFRSENFDSSYPKKNWNQKILEKIDLEQLFDSLLVELENFKEVKFLQAFGGVSLLENFREPFKKIAEKKLLEILEKLDFGKDSFYSKATEMIDKELEKITPQKVKEMVSSIIQKHLSWLVVWGGFFGFFIGFISSFLF